MYGWPLNCSLFSLSEHVQHCDRGDPTDVLQTSPRFTGLDEKAGEVFGNHGLPLTPGEQR